MKNALNRYYLLAIFGHTILFFTIYGLLHLSGIVDVLPNQDSLVKWDANYYASIRDIGYRYVADKTCSAGFFPLFPYFWKLSSLDALGISILNGIIYLLSLAFLCKILKPDLLVLGLFMSLPFMFFMFTPLAESLFFLFSTCILYGIKNNQYRYVFVGLLLASITRASFLFFVPALIGMTLMNNPRQAAFKGSMWKHLLKWYILPIAIAMLTVGLIQYAQTGRFFAYYEIQSTAWARKFGLPVFPLGRNSEIWIVRLSWFNLWIGMLVSAIGLKYLFDWLVKNTVIVQPDKYELFSLIYLIMSFIGIVFFNPEWFWSLSGYSATYLNGINRYMQANPFMLVFLIYIFKIVKKSPYYLLWLFLITHVLWFIVAPNYYNHIQNYLGVSIVTSLLLLYWLYHYFRWKSLAYATILLSFVLQGMMFNYFMSGIQVD